MKFILKWTDLNKACMWSGSSWINCRKLPRKRKTRMISIHHRLINTAITSLYGHRLSKTYTIPMPSNCIKKNYYVYFGNNKRRSNRCNHAFPEAEAAIIKELLLSTPSVINDFSLVPFSQWWCTSAPWFCQRKGSYLHSRWFCSPDRGCTPLGGLINVPG